MTRKHLPQGNDLKFFDTKSWHVKKSLRKCLISHCKSYVINPGFGRQLCNSPRRWKGLILMWLSGHVSQQWLGCWTFLQIQLKLFLKKSIRICCQDLEMWSKPCTMHLWVGFGVLEVEGPPPSPIELKVAYSAWWWRSNRRNQGTHDRKRNYLEGWGCY